MVHRNIHDIEIPFFIWKKLKPLRQQKPNLAFDTETESGKCFLIANSDGDKLNEKEDFVDLYGLLSFLNKQKFKQSVNWAYNLDYDTAAVLKFLSFQDRKHIAQFYQVDYEDYRIQIIPRKELKISKIRDGKSSNPTYFFDLAQFYNFTPLKVLAQQTNYDKVYVEDISQVDLERYYSDTEYHNLWNDRCVIDCKITVELADKLTDNIKKIVNVNSYKSKASIARRYVLENLNHYLKMPATNVLDAALKAFHAGHIETCRLGTFKNIRNYDINCFDIETELLTEKGFKKWDEFTKEDKAATLNLETGHIEYQNILYIHKHQYKGDLLHQKNENLDIMVTPNHRVYYQVHDRNKESKNYNGYSDYKVSLFKDMTNGNIRIPTNGIHPIGKKPDINKDWIKLCAWVITEGHFVKNSDRIIIYQSDKYKYQKEIRKILNNADIKYTEKNRGIRPKHNYSSYEFYISGIDGKYIKDSLNDKKEIPAEWVLKWDKESLEILFWELMKGDGSFRCKKGQADFKSYNDHDLDMMNLIAFKIGYKSSINYKTHSLYIKLIRNGNYAITQTSQRKVKVAYNGMVWCVTVPNDTVVVRRNGKIFITGNSAYPSFIANLYETGGNYTHNKEYEPDTAYSFYLVDLDFYNEYMSPVWYLKSNGNYHINGKCETWITQPEIEYFMANGYDLTIIKAYHIKKNRFTEKPFYNLVHDLYKERLKAKDNKDDIEKVYKVILNSIYGVTLNAIHKKELADYETDLYEIIDDKLVFYESKYIAGNMYNPVFGTFITANTRMKLFNDFDHKLDKIVSVNTDGVYLTSKVNLSLDKKLGNYSYKKLPKMMLMGSGRYFVSDGNGVDNGESRFRGVPLKPDQICEIMKDNKTSQTIELVKEKPIKLKESVRNSNYHYTTFAKFPIQDYVHRDHFNVFNKVVKQIYFKTERRYWFDEIEVISDLWDKQITSRPFDIQELK